MTVLSKDIIIFKSGKHQETEIGEEELPVDDDSEEQAELFYHKDHKSHNIHFRNNPRTFIASKEQTDSKMASKGSISNLHNLNAYIEDNDLIATSNKRTREKDFKSVR